MSSQQGKDVLYVDIDEEITSIIDKVRSSEQRIVALILPKRATVFQSIVNMKLLKRTSEDAKKHIVLITSEPGLLPLAGNVGLYVAKNLQTKPEIPSGPDMYADGANDIEDAEEPSALEVKDNSGSEVDPTKPVAELAKGVPASAAAAPLGDDDTIELDNEDEMPGEEEASASAVTDGKKPKKDRRLFIPNFDRFRLWIVLGGVGVVGLGVLLFFMFSVMPKATINIKTDSSTVNNNLDITLNVAVKELDASKGIIPATSQQTLKTSTQLMDATGQLDKGEKATGSILFYYCDQSAVLSGDPVTVSAGTGVSINGLTFITTTAVSVQPSNYTGPGGTCKKNKPSTSVNMVAQTAGEKYNTAAGNYAVAGMSTVTGSGTATTGGTSQIVKIVQQADIDAAKAKIAAGDTNAVKQELKDKLISKGLYAITATLTTVAPDIQSSASVGEEVANVTVTQKTTYTMLGINEEDLKKVIADSVNKKIDTQKQQILDYGIAKGIFAKQNDSPSGMLVALQVTSLVGTDLDISNVKSQVAGKKAGQAKDIIKEYPGVSDVDVTYSPFWVSSIPTKPGKITVKVEEPKSE